MTRVRSVSFWCLLGFAPILAANALAATDVAASSGSPAPAQRTSMCHKILDRYSSIAHSHVGETIDDWKATCHGDGCNVLHKAAVTLVQAAQESPSDLYEKSMKRLKSKQREQYEAVKQSLVGYVGYKGITEADANADTDDSSDMTETHPLRVPYIDRGAVYLVDVGHQEIGWRVSPDWIVKFVTLQEDGKPFQTAAFTVGMEKEFGSGSVR
jgi:hypothetical protein